MIGIDSRFAIIDIVQTPADQPGSGDLFRTQTNQPKDGQLFLVVCGDLKIGSTVDAEALAGRDDADQSAEIKTVIDIRRQTVNQSAASADGKSCKAKCCCRSWLIRCTVS